MDEPPELRDSSDEEGEDERWPKKEAPKTCRKLKEQSRKIWNLIEPAGNDKDAKESKCGKIRKVKDGKTKEDGKANDREPKKTRNQRRGKDQRRADKEMNWNKWSRRSEDEGKAVEKNDEEPKGSCWAFKEEAKRQMNSLITVEPEGFNAVAHQEEGEWIRLYVDSGATETVVGENMLTMLTLLQSAQSKRGVEYEVATGLKIPNLGEKKFVAHADNGVRRNLTAQVCEVNKALLSVSKVVKAGNKVVFGDEDGSYIEDRQTGERIWMVEEGGMFALEMWVRHDGQEDKDPF